MDLDQSGEVIDLEKLPPAGTIALTGLYYLPIMLLWCVLIERLTGLVRFLGDDRDGYCIGHPTSAQGLVPWRKPME